MRPLRERLADTVTILAGLTALLLAGVFAWDRTQAGPQKQPSTEVENRKIADWGGMVASGKRLGPETAGVVLVMFGDYECPYCRRAARAVRALRESYPDDFAMVFRHFPLESHRNAYSAAQWVECGAAQGHYESVHRILWNAISLDAIDPLRLGTEAGIPDPERFVSCVDEGEGIDQIEEDLATGRELGLRGVPTFVLQGTLLGRSPDSVQLSDMVTAELAQVKAHQVRR